MGGEIRGPLLAALREIHDGHWTRNVGVDGGRTLDWRGKCALIGGCTPAIDQHHALMAIMGERFLLFRMPPMDQEQQADRAMQHVSHERRMRQDLRAAVADLFSSVNLEARDFDQSARKRMAALATFVAHARSAVERDRYHREIELIPSSEMPGRLARTLRCLFQGLQTIGATTEECWRLTSQVALDCIPDVRRKVLTCLAQQSVPVETSAIGEAIHYPTNTARRVSGDFDWPCAGAAPRLCQPGHPLTQRQIHQLAPGSYTGPRRGEPMTVPAIAERLPGNRTRNSGPSIYSFCKHTIQLLRVRCTKRFVERLRYKA